MECRVDRDLLGCAYKKLVDSNYNVFSARIIKTIFI